MEGYSGVVVCYKIMLFWPQPQVLIFSLAVLVQVRCYFSQMWFTKIETAQASIINAPFCQTITLNNNNYLK
jgi:hypothetical protein